MDKPVHSSIPNGTFVARDPNDPASGSQIPAKWCNDLTSEVLNVIKKTGLIPSPNNLDQLYMAVLKVGATDLKKQDKSSPAFFKNGTGVSVKAGIIACVPSAGVFKQFFADTQIVLPMLSAGTDYAIYICGDESIRADVSFVAPAGYSNETSRLIGGFHVGEDLTIFEYSIWDISYRPICDPRGMVLAGAAWVDIYLTCQNHIAYGTSKHGVAVASGAVPPVRPIIMGGGTYGGLDWWTAAEIAAYHKKRLLNYGEFAYAAYGVTENQSIGGVGTIALSKHEPGYRSVFGLEQATGHHWVWGQDGGVRWDAPGGWGWRDAATRGQMYMQGDYAQTKVLLGGSRAGDAFSGSRASLWSNFPWSSPWYIGLRCACDHMSLE